jgi:pimeloyl-ACP methyl ester carboxylesterase
MTPRTLTAAATLAAAAAWTGGAAVRAQQPRPDRPYAAHEVRLRLAGQLTLPRAGGPFPAVIVTTGFGPENGGRRFYEHEAILALTDHLTRQGLAVLRVDHRGGVGEGQPPAVTTTRDISRDLRDALEYLEVHREVVPDRIGVLGHGEGASAAAIAAADNPGLAFLIMLAGAGVPGDEQLRLQFEMLGWAQDIDEEVIARELAIRRRVFEVVKSETGGVANIARRRALVEELTAPLRDEEKPRVQALVEALFTAASTPWFRFLLAYDPRVDLARVRAPALAIAGERDIQVPYRENLAGIRAALEAGGNRDHTVVSLPGLDYLLAPIPSPAARTRPPPISDRVLTIISDWLDQRVR